VRLDYEKCGGPAKAMIFVIAETERKRTGNLTEAEIQREEAHTETRCTLVQTAA